MPLIWHNPATALSELNITVSAKGLAAAQEQCLRIKGLALTTAAPPSESFAQGVVFQALANKQASQADQGDEYGNSSNGVRLYPMDKKIIALLIVPSPVEETDADVTRDDGYVRSLVG